MAVGAHLSKHVDIPAQDAGRIIDAVPFLREVAAGGRPVLGRRVGLPVEVRRAAQWGVQYLVPAAAAQRIVDPTGLEVTGPLPGRALLALAVCRYDDGRGHPIAFARSTFGELSELHGDKGVWRLLDQRADDVMVLAIVTLGVSPTANLLGPLVVNRRSRAAAQVVQYQSSYRAAAPLTPRSET